MKGVIKKEVEMEEEDVEMEEGGVTRREKPKRKPKDET